MCKLINVIHYINKLKDNVIATVPGNKLTQKDNADSGVQFIIPAGPR